MCEVDASRNVSVTAQQQPQLETWRLFEITNRTVQCTEPKVFAMFDGCIQIVYSMVLCLVFIERKTVVEDLSAFHLHFPRPQELQLLHLQLKVQRQRQQQAVGIGAVAVCISFHFIHQISMNYL